MAEYWCHLFDLPSGARIDTLPLEEVSFSRELRGVGSLTGEVPLYGDGLDASRVLQATIPDRTKIFVERGNALVWGGRVVPPRHYDSTTGRLTVAAEETLGAFAHRFVPGLSFAGADQFDIARSLLDVLQSEPGGDMGLGYTTGMSGVTRDVTWPAEDQTAALTALTDLSEAENGFEFATQVAWFEGQPNETLLLGYPRLGRADTSSRLVLEHDQFMGGGNITSYTWEDGAGLFTRSWATSQTAEGARIAVAATHEGLLAQGYPLLEHTLGFEGADNEAALAAHAVAMAEWAAGHHVTARITVHARPGLELGDWQLGDEALVRLSDWRFPPDPGSGVPGFVGYMRIMGYEVTPAPEGEERYEFVMGDMLEHL